MQIFFILANNNYPQYNSTLKIKTWTKSHQINGYFWTSKYHGLVCFSCWTTKSSQLQLLLARLRGYFGDWFDHIVQILILTPMFLSVDIYNLLQYSTIILSKGVKRILDWWNILNKTLNHYQDVKVLKINRLYSMLLW